MNADWRRIQNKKIIYPREDPNSVTNHITIRAIRNPWNLILLNNIRDERDSKKNRIYLSVKRKKLSVMAVEK